MSEFIIVSILFNGIKPPEDIMESDKLNESKVLKFINFKIKKINNVSNEYKIKTLNNCFKVSEELNEEKTVSDFFRLLSNISIKRIIENKKYKPPIHCVVDRQIIKL
tara:strand:+ start:130 stop:450 length:321 start_codon:yes stop_codon:yes gene_type:complete